MMQIPKWRSLCHLKQSLVSNLPTMSTTQFALIHSTPSSCDKRKKKCNFDGRGAQQPSKNIVRSAIRQKRREEKRSLKKLLFGKWPPKISLQDEVPIWSFSGRNGQDSSDSSGKRESSKFSAQYDAKPQHTKMNGKHKRASFFEDFENVFEANFGSRTDPSFQSSSTSGFEWREHSNSEENNRSKRWDSTKSEGRSCQVGSCSDRTILGLPPTGLIEIGDVKSAFRLSALKWHPDKHQGPSQEMAEEKFKKCVDAYKSLCDALA